MNAIDFFRAIQNGAEYRASDIDRLIYDEYEKNNARMMFADFVGASGKSHLLDPPPNPDPLTGDGFDPNQPRDWRGRWTKIGAGGYVAPPNRAAALRAVREASDLYGESPQLEHARENFGRVVRGERALPPAPDQMTTEHLENEIARMEAIVKKGAPPQGGYDYMNALYEEQDQRRAVDLKSMTNEQIEANIEKWAQSENPSHRVLARQARREIENRERQARFEMEQRAQLEFANNAPDYTTLSAAELDARTNEAIAQLRNSERGTYEEALAEAHYSHIRREQNIRGRVADVRNLSETGLQNAIAGEGSDPRLVAAAELELRRRRDVEAPIRSAMENDFSAAKKSILEEGGIKNDWDEHADPTWNPTVVALRESGVTPEDIVTPFMAKSFYEKNPIGVQHDISDQGESIAIRISTPDGGRVERTFSTDEYGNIVVSHDYFSLRSGDQGKGTSKEIMRNSMEAYEKIGISRVDVHANIDAGGYVWARYGFVPTQGSWDDLKYDLGAKVYDLFGDDASEAIYAALNSNDPKAIWAIADTREGKELLAGTDWYGELYMTDSEAVNRFKTYSNK